MMLLPFALITLAAADATLMMLLPFALITLAAADATLGVAESLRGGVWREAPKDYASIAREERKKGAKGKYVVAFADDYGLGNRVNVVVSSLALAVASGRALAIVWPRVDCRHSHRENCDPTSVDDLFVEANVSWGLNKHIAPHVVKCRDDRDRKRKTLDRWAMADPNDRKTADHYRKLDFDASWRGDDRVLCTYGYFYWGWALASPRSLEPAPDEGRVAVGRIRRVAGLAARAVARGREARPRHPREGGGDVGVHLRRRRPRRGANVFNPKWVAVLEAQLDALPRDARVFIAADHESAHTKVKLVDVVRSRGGALLGTDKATANRDSDGGIYDALAENYALSSCGELLPRGTGATFRRRGPRGLRAGLERLADGGVRRAAQGPPRAAAHQPGALRGPPAAGEPEY
ncbi:hypothetical protein JL720_11922 [Aureococcus anophagefferens]|nr:hypothetical protein JL720_11922 [Aureococcus anophagefferens]